MLCVQYSVIQKYAVTGLDDSTEFWFY